MLAPLNPQLQGLLPLDRSHDKFFQLHLFKVLTVHSGVLSYHLHGTDFPLHFIMDFPSLRIRLPYPRRKTFAFYSACDVGNKVQNCNSCTSLPGTCARSPTANLFPLSLLGTSFVAGGLSGGLWLTASPWLLITLPLGTLWGALLPVLLVSVVDITATSTRKFAWCGDVGGSTYVVLTPSLFPHKWLY